MEYPRKLKNAGTEEDRYCLVREAYLPRFGGSDASGFLLIIDDTTELRHISLDALAAEAHKFDEKKKKQNSYRFSTITTCDVPILSTNMAVKSIFPVTTEQLLYFEKAYK